MATEIMGANTLGTMTTKASAVTRSSPAASEKNAKSSGFSEIMAKQSGDSSGMPTTQPMTTDHPHSEPSSSPEAQPQSTRPTGKSLPVVTSTKDSKADGKKTKKSPGAIANLLNPLVPAVPVTTNVLAFVALPTSTTTMTAPRNSTKPVVELAAPLVAVSGDAAELLHPASTGLTTSPTATPSSTRSGGNADNVRNLPKGTLRNPDSFLQNLAQAVSVNTASTQQSYRTIPELSLSLTADAVTASKSIPSAIQGGVSGPLPVVLAGVTPTAAPASSSVAVVAPPVGANPQWGSALGQQVQFLLGQGVQQATLHLNPPHLGPLEVHLDMQANGEAHAFFSSPHPEVLQAISTAIPQLQQSFAAAGMSLGQASVGSESGNRPFPRSKSSFTSTVPSIEDIEGSKQILTTIRVQLGLINAFA